MSIYILKITFLYINREQLEIKNFKVPFNTTKNRKCLVILRDMLYVDINLTKYVQDLYTKDYKILMK